MDVVKRICDQVAVISGELVESDAVKFSLIQTPVSQALFNQHYNWIFLKITKNEWNQREEGLFPLLKLEFNGQSVDAPLMSIVARRFDADIILKFTNGYAGGVKFGDVSWTTR